MFGGNSGYSQGYPNNNQYSQQPPQQPLQQQGGYSSQNHYPQDRLVSPPMEGFEADRDIMAKADCINESMNLDQMISQMTGTSLNIDEAELQQSARSVQGFDPNSLQSNFEQFRDLTGGGASGERGLFNFNTGQGKSPFTHQLLAGAAAWYGVKFWQNRQGNQYKPVNHAFMKKAAAAGAAAMAIRWWEKSGGWQSGMNRDVVAREAAQNAMLAYDAKNPEAFQSQYQYNYSSTGEAASFDSFGGGGPAPQPGSGGYYNQPTSHQNNYPPY